MSDDHDLKPCAVCGALIPSVATKCAYCQTSNVDTGAPASRMVRPAARRGPITVTTALIWANVLYYAWTMYLGNLEPGARLTNLLISADATALFWGGWYDHKWVVKGEWYRLFTAMFLHGGLMHIGFNMYALHQLGRIAEGIFGPARFLVIYLATGVCSMAAVSIWFIYIQGGTGHVPVVGASGAIFGIAGLLIVFLKRRGSAVGQAIARSLAINIGLLLVLGFVIQFISNTGHVGGLIPGMLFGLFCSGGFKDRIDPAAAKRWTLAAAMLAALTTMALGQAVFRVLERIG